MLSSDCLFWNQDCSLSFLSYLRYYNQHPTTIVGGVDFGFGSLGFLHDHITYMIHVPITSTSPVTSPFPPSQG